MSRTFKDRPHRIRFPETSGGTWYTYSCPEKGSKKLKRKELDTEDHWMHSTPSWWNNMFHTRPQRNNGHMWEREVVKTAIDDVEDLDPPIVGNKPHKYYW